MTYLDPADTDPREERLPKWARSAFALMRQRLRDAERARDAARLETEPGESSAVLDAYSDIPIGLGPDARVTFKLGDLRVQCYRDEWGRLYVQGSDPFAVYPQSSNVVQIAPKERA